MPSTSHGQQEGQKHGNEIRHREIKLEISTHDRKYVGYMSLSCSASETRLDVRSGAAPFFKSAEEARMLAMCNAIDTCEMQAASVENYSATDSSNTATY